MKEKAQLYADGDQLLLWLNNLKDDITQHMHMLFRLYE